jgi:hypothetical protein
MAKFRVTPREVEAVQFDGRNWVEMGNFCGTRKDANDYELPTFTPTGTFMVTFFATGGTAELWSEKYKKVISVKVGEWVVKGDEGFFTVPDALFKTTFEKVT